MDKGVVDKAVMFNRAGDIIEEEAQEGCGERD